MASFLYTTKELFSLESLKVKDEILMIKIENSKSGPEPFELVGNYNDKESEFEILLTGPRKTFYRIKIAYLAEDSINDKVLLQEKGIIYMEEKGDMFVIPENFIPMADITLNNILIILELSNMPIDELDPRTGLCIKSRFPEKSTTSFHYDSIDTTKKGDVYSMTANISTAVMRIPKSKKTPDINITQVLWNDLEKTFMDTERTIKSAMADKLAERLGDKYKGEKFRRSIQSLKDDEGLSLKRKQKGVHDTKIYIRDDKSIGSETRSKSQENLMVTDTLSKSTTETHSITMDTHSIPTDGPDFMTSEESNLLTTRSKSDETGIHSRSRDDDDQNPELIRSRIKMMKQKQMDNDLIINSRTEINKEISISKSSDFDTSTLNFPKENANTALYYSDTKSIDSNDVLKTEAKITTSSLKGKSSEMMNEERNMNALEDRGASLKHGKAAKYFTGADVDDGKPLHKIDINHEPSSDPNIIIDRVRNLEITRDYSGKIEKNEKKGEQVVVLNDDNN